MFEVLGTSVQCAIGTKRGQNNYYFVNNWWYSESCIALRYDNNNNISLTSKLKYIMYT